MLRRNDHSAGRHERCSGADPHPGVRWSAFLLDVLVCSLGAYGGPEAHYGVFAHRMVGRKRYIDDEELGELIDLTSIVPGPSSTQTIVAIGYKVGGPMLAFLTVPVWVVPAVVAMTVLSFLYGIFDERGISTDILRFVGPMAVGFIFEATYGIGKKVLKGPVNLLLFLLAAGTTFFYRTVWVFPLLLTFGVSSRSSYRENGGYGIASACVRPMGTRWRSPPSPSAPWR